MHRSSVPNSLLPMESIFPTVLLVLFAVIAAATPAPAATTTKPPKGACTIGAVAVDAPDVNTDGSGCRPGTVGVAISEDNSLMTLIFDDFQAAIGPKAGNVKKRALCRVNITMSSPGWAFEVDTVDFRGYVNLASGVDASIVSRWKWVDTKGQDMKGKVRKNTQSVSNGQCLVQHTIDMAVKWTNLIETLIFFPSFFWLTMR